LTLTRATVEQMRFLVQSRIGMTLEAQEALAEDWLRQEEALQAARAYRDAEGDHERLTRGHLLDRKLAALAPLASTAHVP
jgi:hypothetical protein